MVDPPLTAPGPGSPPSDVAADPDAPRLPGIGRPPVAVGPVVPVAGSDVDGEQRDRDETAAVRPAPVRAGEDAVVDGERHRARPGHLPVTGRDADITAALGALLMAVGTALRLTARAVPRRH